jgi:hypothetical protein
MYRSRTCRELMGPRAPQTIHPVFSSLNSPKKKKEKLELQWNNATRRLYFDQALKSCEAWVSVRNTEWAQRSNYCWCSRVTWRQLHWSVPNVVFLARKSNSSEGAGTTYLQNDIMKRVSRNFVELDCNPKRAREWDTGHPLCCDDGSQY